MEFPTINIKREKIIKSIKGWLLCYGQRDPYGFHLSVGEYDIYLSYEYSLDGTRNYQHFSINSIKDKDCHCLNLTDNQFEEILGEIINIYQNGCLVGFRPYWDYSRNAYTYDL